MTRKKNRDGHVVVRSEPAFDSGSEHHTPQGDMIFESKHAAREWAAKVNDATGRRIVVDPDGGVPGGTEADDRHLAQERREHAEGVRSREQARRREFQERLRSRDGS